MPSLAGSTPSPPLASLRHLLFALCAYGVLLVYFRLRAKALSPAIAESRLQALQARIRPHFLFNSINAVLSLVRSDPKRAETALLDMADLFRVLMRDNRELVPIADEIELCRQYLELEKLRLSDRLTVEWHLNNMPADALVPPLVLQPLLENAVYHGIEPSSAPGVVSINIFCKGGDVHAILRNPYQSEGGRHHAGNKMALGNIRERLQLHFDAEGTLESRVRESTYEVHLRMPYRTAQSAAAREGSPATADTRGEPDRDARAAGAAAKPTDRRCGWPGRESPVADAPLRVLIVDDEVAGAAPSARLLADCAGALPLACVGEAANGREALELLHAVSADLVLTDIEMPEMGGLEFARHVLKLPQPPVVIFTTAHDKHAVQAFEVNAVDFLLKPIRVQRLLAALERVPRLKPVSATRLDALPSTARRFLSVTERSRVVLVPVDEIVYLKAELKYITIRTAEREFLLEESLTKLEEEFGARLVRVHRNCLVARDAIRGFERRVGDEGDAHWEVLLEGHSRNAAGVAPAAIDRPGDRTRKSARGRRGGEVKHALPVPASGISATAPHVLAHTRLRFARLRHDHGVPGSFRTAHPAGPDAHAVGVVPDRRDAPRMGRLRRQHRLQPARRSAASRS